MDDLDAMLLKVADSGRAELLREISRLGAQADRQIRAGNGKKNGSRLRLLADHARSRRDRIGRIGFFLHHREYADHATEKDRALCDALASKLDRPKAE